MATADELLDQILSWIEQRERCAKQLRKLAQELESLKKNCTASKCVGNSVVVVGAACLIGAGVATLLTGGAAAPLVGLAGSVCTGTGTAISLTTTITESFLSSDTMKEAKEIDKESNETAERIQKLSEKLKDEMKKMNPDPEELDQYTVTEIWRAMARRSGLEINFNYCNDMPQFFHSGGQIVTARSFSPDMMTLGFTIALIFAMDFCGKGSKFHFDKGAQQLIKVMSKGVVLKGCAKVAGGVVGMMFALPEAIDNWKEMIKNNHVTEASRSLRDAADKIQKTTQVLREQLNNTEEALQEMAERQREELSKNLLKLAEENCKDETVLKWLRENSESGSFIKLVDVYQFVKKHIDEEEKKNHGDCVDITFVSHGAISDFMIPACCLLPLPTITDVVLYSPWNCVTSGLTYYVATGRIRPEHRVFYCRTKKGCKIPDERHRPVKLPNHWNSMKKAGGQMIPNISVSPLRPNDGVWKYYESLTKKHGCPGRNRIVIPFTLSVGSVPFSVVTLALSLVLLSSRFKATVHFSACLSDQSAGQKFDRKYLQDQYACTIDNTVMTVST